MYKAGGNPIYKQEANNLKVVLVTPYLQKRPLLYELWLRKLALPINHKKKNMIDITSVVQARFTIRTNEAIQWKLFTIIAISSSQELVCTSIFYLHRSWSAQEHEPEPKPSFAHTKVYLNLNWWYGKFQKYALDSRPPPKERLTKFWSLRLLQTNARVSSASFYSLSIHCLVLVHYQELANTYLPYVVNMKRTQHASLQQERYPSGKD
jgi:hypothetical protein